MNGIEELTGSVEGWRCETVGDGVRVNETSSSSHFSVIVHSHVHDDGGGSSNTTARLRLAIDSGRNELSLW